MNLTNIYDNDKAHLFVTKLKINWDILQVNLMISLILGQANLVVEITLLNNRTNRTFKISL